MSEFRLPLRSLDQRARRITNTVQAESYSPVQHLEIPVATAEVALLRGLMWGGSGPVGVAKGRVWDFALQ